MQITSSVSAASLKTSQFWLIGIATSLITIHLTLLSRGKDVSLLGTSTLFWFAVCSLIWSKRHTLNLESGALSSFWGVLLILQQFKERVVKASNNDLESLIASAKARGISPDVKSPQELKVRLLTQANNTEKTLKTQVAAMRRTKVLGLMKSSLKLNLGALISGVWFIRIWHATRWARQASKRKRGW